MEGTCIRRRLVQSTLFPHREISAKEENCNGNREDEVEEEKGNCSSKKTRESKRKANLKPRKTTPGSSEKVTENGKEASKRQMDGCDSPLKSGFSGNASQRRLRKRQRNQQLFTDSPEKSDDVCSTSSSAKNGKKTPRKLQQQDNSTPRKERMKSTPSIKMKTSSRKLCYSQTPFDHTVDEQPLQTIPDLRLEAKLTAEENSRIFAGRQIHPFFASWKGKKTSEDLTESDNKFSSFERKEKGIAFNPIHVFENIEDEHMILDWGHWIYAESNSMDGLQNECSPVYGDSVDSLNFDNFLSSSNTTRSSLYKYSGHLIIPKKEVPVRIMSLYHTSDNQPENCVWTDKYRPQYANQICGNGESVKFLSEWLQLWHKKGLLTSRIRCNEDKSIVGNIDHDYQQTDSDSDSIEDEEGLKNVLLVAGPVGSGKSSAVYACARDQGFQIIEINASDWRNGALIKQKIGEAVESHWLQRKVENLPTSNGNSLSKFYSTVKTEMDGSDIEAIDLIDLSDKEDSQDASVWPKTSTSGENIAANCQKEIKTLILFEDVDATLSEDQGFITTIQQLAHTAKRPMILTSNCENPVLPKNLDRSELSFSVPSLEELLGLVHMICAAEKIEIHPCLVERFVDYCQGDIRKTIMLLQFWNQGQNLDRGNELYAKYGPVPFDTDAAHHILPKVIPWGYPSQLSELVEEKVICSLILNEEIHGFGGTIKSKDLNDIFCRPNFVDANEPMINLNYSLQDELESSQFDSKLEFPNSSGSPITFARQNRRKMNAVLSSDSEDNLCAGSDFLFSDRLFDVNIEAEEDFSRLSDRVNYSQIDDSCKSHDTPLVPGSSFVPETEIIMETDLYTTTVSYGDFFDTRAKNIIRDQDSVSIPEITSGSLFNNSLQILQNVQEILENNYGASTSCVYQEEVGDSLSKSESDVIRGFQVLDACSQVDVTRLKDGPKAEQVTNSVQETWNKLHDQRKDLKKYVTDEEKNAYQALKCARGMSNLISEADLLLKDCHTSLFDSIRSIMIPSENTNSYCYYDNQLEMSSVLAQHGMCYYAKEIASLGLIIGSPSGLNLASEMLSFSSSSIALGKLASQNRTTVDGSDIKMQRNSTLLTRKSDSSICNILQSLVPPRSYLAMKGGAFHEYTSTLTQISRFEAIRISECLDKRKQRRGRVTQHYLSSGSLAMSSEEIALLDRYNCYQNGPPIKDES